MTFELWVIIGISLGAGLASSILTSPLFWRNLLTRKTIWADEENNGIKKDNVLALSILNVFAFIGIPLFSVSAYHLSCRISLFCGGSLIAIFGFVAFKIFYQLFLYEKQNIKIAIILFSVFVIYLACFIYDNIMFAKAEPQTKIEEITLSEKILPDELTISSHDFVNLSILLNNQNSTLHTYRLNGKIILNCSTQNYFIIIDGEKVNQYFYSSIWKIGSNNPPLPIELGLQNPKKLGLGISDNNTIYFVYALLSQKSLLGKYEVTQYALYNPLTEKITCYSKFPPIFLN